jgi:hypothetical protein
MNRALAILLILMVALLVAASLLAYFGKLPPPQ